MPLIRKDPAPAGPAAELGDAMRVLTSGSSDARFTAARALSGNPEAVPALGQALTSEQDGRVREAILTALSRVGTAQAAQMIMPLIRSEDASVRTGALDALRLMPDAVAGHLAELLADSDADVRLLACELARQLPGPLATRLICDFLDHETEPNVCAAALDVLAEAGGTEALPVLARCQDRFADIPFLSFATRVAADRIRAKPSGDRG